MLGRLLRRRKSTADGGSSLIDLPRQGLAWGRGRRFRWNEGTPSAEYLPEEEPELTWSAPEGPWPGWEVYEQIRAEPGFIDPQLQVRCIVGLARADAPAGVEEFTFYGQVVGVHFAECEAEYLLPDGSLGRFVPTVHWGYLYRLREALHLPGSGAWYSIRISVTADGRVEADYDYDHEPFFRDGRRPSADDYRRDTTWFLRHEEHTPPWLRERLLGLENPALRASY